MKLAGFMGVHDARGVQFYIRGAAINGIERWRGQEKDDPTRTRMILAGKAGSDVYVMEDIETILAMLQHIDLNGYAED